MCVCVCVRTGFCLCVSLFIYVCVYLSVCVYVNEGPSHYAIGDNPVLLMNMDELMDEVDRIIEMGDPVGDFLTSDEFTSVDPGLVDTDLVNPDEVNMNEHSVATKYHVYSCTFHWLLPITLF